MARPGVLREPQCASGIELVHRGLAEACASGGERQWFMGDPINLPSTEPLDQLSAALGSVRAARSQQDGIYIKGPFEMSMPTA